MTVKTAGTATGVFLLWMLASFLCHKLAKTAIQLLATAASPSPSPSPSYPVVLSLAVTCCQMVCCLATVSPRGLYGPLFHVTALSHFLATWATNASLALTFASSTMAVKMLEPVSSAVLQTLLLRTPMGPRALTGVAVVVTGAVMYVGDPLADRDVARGLTLAMVSNLTLGIRNVAIKLQQRGAGDGGGGGSDAGGTGGGGSRRIQLRSAHKILVFNSAFLLILGVVSWMSAFLSFPSSSTSSTPDSAADPLSSSSTSSSSSSSLRQLPSFLLLALASGVCHVTYSYVSTNLVLRHLTVVSHALANILKRVLVVLLLYASGRRVGVSALNFLGLALCTAGLFVYSQGKGTTRSSSPFSSSSALSSPSSLRDSKDEKNDSGNNTSPKTSRKILTGLFLPLIAVFALCVFTDEQPYAKTAHARRDLREALSPGHQTAGAGGDPDSFLGGGGETESFLAGQTQLVSKYLPTSPGHPNKSGDYAANLRHGFSNLPDGRPLLARPTQYQPDRKDVAHVREFLGRPHLLDTPFDTDGLAPYLTTNTQVTAELQRVHANLFGDLFRGKKYAVLGELASHENKGDAALTVGELVMLENMGVRLLFHINVGHCEERLYRHGLKLAQQYPKEEVVFLMHAGGNIFGYPIADVCREKGLRVFNGYDAVLLSQSIYMRASRHDFDFATNLYCCNPRLTMLMRDRLSLDIARSLFNNGTRLLLAPDMAFQIGTVTRYLPPFYDVIWQRRQDAENPMLKKVTLPSLGANVTLLEWDWLGMRSLPKEGAIRKAVSIQENGLAILQQGRVLVTDRLHGHILSTLLGIPHVLLDNAQQKLSSYHNTWTRGVKNCRLADNPQDAARMALELLAEYQDSLPKRLTIADVDEHPPLSSEAPEKKEEEEKVVKGVGDPSLLSETEKKKKEEEEKVVKGVGDPSLLSETEKKKKVVV